MFRTRRDFLRRVGETGGFSAAFVTMQSLGLMPMASVDASEVKLPAEAGKGLKIAILGGRNRGAGFGL
jgi:monoamine oxidase